MNNLKDLIEYVTGFITLLTPVVGALAVFVFIRGLLKFISNAGDVASHKEGKNLMIWGIVALFVMVGFVGIISLAQSIAGTKSGGPTNYLHPTPLPLIKP